jgi:DNA modification methylase
MGGAFYIWHSDSEGKPKIACIKAKWKLLQTLIWSKGTQWLWVDKTIIGKHEPCLYGWKEGQVHIVGIPIENNTTIIKYDRNNNLILHPTMKPVGLME